MVPLETVCWATSLRPKQGPRDRHSLQRRRPVKDARPDQERKWLTAGGLPVAISESKSSPVQPPSRRAHGQSTHQIPLLIRVRGLPSIPANDPRWAEDQEFDYRLKLSSESRSVGMRQSVALLEEEPETHAGNNRNPTAPPWISMSESQ